ncbi:MAG: DUF350 domain-containing protein [Gemmatimonadetes bacterium]|jgi:uncharacterized membrane protein YjfL (UPF0719 family)|nr:DUF350 domain-containing protein [Gemmatimonadota bacterium]MBT5057102.1 DUF350 domain-containing protein [Gemmatimonadota bacterium]MBT5142158.1 DUF350 domain-containing protein [Gemmatimonadota bacterium]MBT5589257.1 DUF350 domain-containing protein [Gemmatimonadota bacterium]MBT5963093.1 DUF350 domain-containing protein [Gemmatimonadota bacterium]
MENSMLMPMARATVYLLEAFVLLVVAKWAYTGLYRRVCLREELFEKGNVALAVSTAGYLFGITIALGGVLAGPSAGWQADLLGISVYGGMTVAMMLVASWLCEKVLLSRFNNTKEVVEDQNLGTAFVEAGVHIANGLILLAIQQGSGAWWIGVVFWALAQVALMVVGLVYEKATTHSIHDELERDNAAVGLAFAGVLVGMGNIISLAVAGDFTSWKDSLITFGADVAFGLVILLVIKRLTDVVLAPGVSLAAQQTQEKPQIGAGLLEAFGYVGGSMLVVWVF